MNDIEIRDDADRLPAMLFLNGGIVTEQDALDAVDVVLEQLEKTNDLSPVDMTLKSLLGMQRISGKSLAKLLWGTKDWWVRNNMDKQTGDTFDDRMVVTHGLKPVVIDRYICLWDKVEKDMLPKRIQARPLKDQIAIAKTIDQGYDIRPTDWKKLEKAVNNNKVLEILREVKGKKARKSSLQIYEERDGTIVAWDGEGERHVLGWLNINDEKDVPAVHKGLERIRKGSGLIKR